MSHIENYFGKESGESSRQTGGGEGFRQFLTDFFRAFPDMHTTNGDRSAGVRDPVGNHWIIATHKVAKCPPLTSIGKVDRIKKCRELFNITGEQ